MVRPRKPKPAQVTSGSCRFYIKIPTFKYDEMVSVAESEGLSPSAFVKMAIHKTVAAVRERHQQKAG